MRIIINLYIFLKFILLDFVILFLVFPLFSQPDRGKASEKPVKLGKVAPMSEGPAAQRPAYKMGIVLSVKGDVRREKMEPSKRGTFKKTAKPVSASGARKSAKKPAVKKAEGLKKTTPGATKAKPTSSGGSKSTKRPVATPKKKKK